MEANIITAKVETASGTKIVVTGSKAEVTEILASIERKSVSARTPRSKTRHQSNGTRGKLMLILAELARDGYFEGAERTIQEVVERVNEKGYNVRGRMIGALAKNLTLACRDSEIGLQRRQLPKAERKAKEQWVFTKKK